MNPRPSRSPWLYVCAAVSLVIGLLAFGGGTIDPTARFPQLSLSGETNIVADNGSMWTFNGVPFCTNCAVPDLWTNDLGVLKPVDLTLQPTTELGWYVGTNSQAYWGAPLTGGEALISVRNRSLGDPNNNEVFLFTTPDGVRGGQFDLYLRTNSAVMTLLATDAAASSGFNLQESTTNLYLQAYGGTIGNTRAFNYAASDGQNEMQFVCAADTNLVLDAQNTRIILGPGATNVIKRIGSQLVYEQNSVNAYRIPATNWDDSQVPEAMVRVGATAPALANFNGGPAQTLQFQNNRDDTIMATVQMTHRWKQGTDVHPHVHWCETATTGAGTNIVWQLVYTWTNIGCAYPAYTTVAITNSVTGTNWFSQLSDFPAIAGTGKLVSSIFVFELRRLANTAAADDYNQSVAFLGFDIHHQVDSPGSDSELTKSW